MSAHPRKREEKGSMKVQMLTLPREILFPEKSEQVDKKLRNTRRGRKTIELATYLKQGHKKIALLEADLRNPDLTRRDFVAIKGIIASQDQRLRRRCKAVKIKNRVVELQSIIGDFISLLGDTCGNCTCTPELVKGA
jgi:hypothetical protein